MTSNCKHLNALVTALAFAIALLLQALILIALQHILALSKKADEIHYPPISLSQLFEARENSTASNDLPNKTSDPEVYPKPDTKSEEPPEPDSDLEPDPPPEAVNAIKPEPEPEPEPESEPAPAPDPTLALTPSPVNVPASVPVPKPKVRSKQKPLPEKKHKPMTQPPPTALPKLPESPVKSTKITPATDARLPENRKTHAKKEAAAEPDVFKNYLKSVFALIESGKVYPEQARRRNTTGNVDIEFSLKIDGTPFNTRAINRRRTPRILSDAAVNLVNSLKFPAPPAGWDESSSIKITIHYQLR